MAVRLGRVAMQHLGQYNNIIEYEPLDIVSYEGSGYVCIENTKGHAPTDTAYWQLLASKGDIGTTGATGATGPEGKQGIQGEAGPPGTGDMLISQYGGSDSNTVRNSDRLGQILANEYYSAHSVTGAIATLNSPQEGLPLDITARTVAAQSGSGNPSPDNVRVITGRSSITATRHNENFWKPYQLSGSVTYSGVVWTYNADGTIAVNGSTAAGIYSGMDFMGGSQTNTVPLFTLPSGTYVLKRTGVSNIQAYLRPVKDGVLGTAYSARVNDVIFSLTENTAFARLLLQIDPATTVNNVTLRPLLAAGSDAAYIPYAGDSYQIALPDMVYGLPNLPDEIDLINGRIIKHTALRSFTGTENITTSSLAVPAGLYVYSIPLTGAPNYGSMVVSDRGMCSHFRYNGTATSSQRRDNDCFVYTNSTLQTNLYIVTTMATVTEVKNYLAAQHAAGKPVQLVHELAEPVIEQINPITVASLSGLNHIWSNAGGETTAAVRVGNVMRKDIEDLYTRLAALEERIKN